jgi:Inorganic H+ pyrophosphatase
MAGMGEEIRERTDALDAAGNTTAAIGKGFAIGSAALVSLALFGAYITRAQIKVADSSILDPEVRSFWFCFARGFHESIACPCFTYKPLYVSCVTLIFQLSLHCLALCAIATELGLHAIRTFSLFLLPLWEVTCFPIMIL